MIEWGIIICAGAIPLGWIFAYATEKDTYKARHAREREN